MAKEVVKPDYKSLSYDELSKISRDDHQEDTRQYDKQQNALCLVMIGSILLICGILFLILSSVRRYNQMVGIDPGSLQFIVSMACFGGAVILLTLGLVRFFIAFGVRKHLKQEIIEVAVIKRDLMKSNE